MKSKLTISRCETYKKNNIKSIIAEGLARLGGPENYIDKNHGICIKPNLLLPALPETGITTHPLFIEAVVELVADYTGKPGNIIIADSFAPGVPFNRSGIEKIYKETGILGVSERTGCSLNYSTDYSSVSNKKGGSLKKIEIINTVLDCPTLINLPKFKTHNLTTLTGAVKNMFGVVPGFTKVGYHLRFDDLNIFTGMLIDIVNLVKPSINIMDGILGIEGDGPGRSGTPINTGIIMISDDPIAMDLVAGQLMGVDEEHNPYVRIAKERGISSAFRENIEIIGDTVEDYVIKDFKLPKSVGQEYLIENKFISKHIIPKIRNYLNPYPYADMAKCSNCITCQKICPQKVIKCTDNSVDFDYAGCIRCFCCSEMCPEGAIDTRFSFLGNLILNRFGLLGQKK